MIGRRRLLVALASALVLVSLLTAYVATREEPAEVVAAAEPRPTPSTTSTSSTTTAAPTTTAPPPPTTTTAPATTSPPTIAPPPVPPAPPQSAAPPSPPFQASIETVTTAQLGSSWKPDMGCPAAEQLRAVELSHWGYDGAVHQGRLIVAASQAERIVAVFRDLFAARFPIQRMVPVDAYGGDDGASMRANNTSGFNCRVVANTKTLSEHGKGLAVDVNPLVNPYVSAGGAVDPPEGAAYADRGRSAPGMIKAGDAVVQAFARQGWGWGGYWGSAKDYQHFSVSGR